ncbi:hypothetical protein IGI04_016382, partial [Brassica rapa subsp. trilocularis]
GSELDMNWVQRKIYLYNVTFGLYMLDCSRTELLLFPLTFSFRFFGCNPDVVYSVQWISLLLGALQETSFLKPGHSYQCHGSMKTTWSSETCANKNTFVLLFLNLLLWYHI